MSEPKIVPVTLQPAGVIAPTNRAVVFSTNVVATCLRALDADPCDEIDPNGYGFGYRFNGLTLNNEERRLNFKNWVLAKGFHDLARGIRETLEEAYLFVHVWREVAGKSVSRQDFDQTVADANKVAGKRNFPDLLELVNNGLQERLAFEAEFLSLQKVRNCLEHRGGRVSEQDIDSDSGVMSLHFPRLKIFFKKGEQEIEMLSGESFDTHEINSDINVARQIFVKRVVRERVYNISEAIQIEARDFFEIALACQMFANDLATKLPGVPAQTD